MTNDKINKNKLKNYIFSIKNNSSHKIFTVFGIKIKFKKKWNKHKFIKLLRNTYINGINKEKVNYEIECFNQLGVTEIKRNKKIIISLTSFPERMYDLHYAIYSLLNQTLKPDEVILWLAKEQFKDKKISQKVLNLQKNGLTIKWCEDIKSYKKLIPTLKEYPNDIIVTADDDIFYPADWLKDLYTDHLEYPNTIIAKRCHKVNLNKKYNNWKHCIDDNTISFSNFFTGAGGVLYPPNSLYKDILNDTLFNNLAPNADDIWFWAMAILNNTKIKVCKNSYTELTYVTPEREFGLYNEQTLYKSNGKKNENDIQINAILKQYPNIKKIVKQENFYKFTSKQKKAMEGGGKVKPS